ncbi:tape measure protein [Cylindrospermopsis phage Cr-LKS4]|nr:tape measure protein [Cylindrospermopsis phage Cr-LKS4]
MKVVKVVINVASTLFDLSDKALEKYSKLSGIPEYYLDARRISRHCPHLVRIVEEMGVEADTEDTALVIEEVKGDRYHILSTKEGVEYVITPEIVENIKWVRAI